MDHDGTAPLETGTGTSSSEAESSEIVGFLIANLVLPDWLENTYLVSVR